MDVMKRLAELLDDASPRKRIAAAVVLGELGAKDAQVVSRLVEMAADPLDAYAEAAIDALGQLKAMRALPVLLDALGRSKDVQACAKNAIAALGEDVLPQVQARMAQVSPDVRAVLSQLLPAVGGRQSFALALEGMRGQPWDDINKVALSVRHEAKSATPAERRSMKTQVEAFLAKKKTADDELALRGAIKVLGFLELPEAQDTLLGYLSPKQSSAVRVEAATALRFSAGAQPSTKTVKKLMSFMLDTDVALARAARDSMSVLPLGPELIDELAELCRAAEGEVAVWAIRHVGTLAAAGKPASIALVAKTLHPIAGGADKARAEAAAQVLAGLPKGASLLADALLAAEEEVGAHAISDVLTPLASSLTPKEVKALAAAGAKSLGTSIAVARRQLDPVRAVDAEAWADVLRTKAKALKAKDPARAELISQLLGKSAAATGDDRFSMVVQQLLHHSLDPHPRARQRDPALAELEKLQAEGFGVAAQVLKHSALSDEARYYVGVHFAEKPSFEHKNVGAEVLEALAGKGRTKISKAAKNKLALLEL